MDVVFIGSDVGIWFLISFSFPRSSLLLITTEVEGSKVTSLSDSSLSRAVPRSFFRNNSRKTSGG